MADLFEQQQAEQRKAEISQLSRAIGELISHVPKRVLDGSHGLAVDWKKAAQRARQAVESKRQDLDNLRKAHNDLRQFYT